MLIGCDKVRGVTLMDLQKQIDAFLGGQRFAVVGASRDRRKYGNKVVRVYLQNHREVYPVNPHADQIEGLQSYAGLSSLPQPVDAVSIITPPPVTEQIVLDAIEAGIGHLWMQPGAESSKAVQLAKDAGINVIHDGPCILVTLGFQEHP